MSKSHLPANYEIEIKDKLSEDWGKWFGGMEIIEEESGNTILKGKIEDQAELFGIIKKIRALGIYLVSIKPEDQEGEK